MASFWFTTGLAECLDGTIDLDTDTLKLVPQGTSVATYAPDRDHLVFDNGANDTTDPSYCELVATNYTGGWGGAGRKTATIAIAADLTNDRVKCTITDLTWTALGGATNDTVTGFLLIKEGGANDTTSRLIAWIDHANVATNGADFQLDFDATDGNLWLTTA